MGFRSRSTYSVVGKAFSLPMRLRVACEVLAGLHYAHGLVDYSGAPLGLVHRDVSPQNVFLTYDGRVKVLDFGIAKVGAAQDQTRFGVIKGRIAYMPPEQVMGQRVDHRADIYAMGCLLWEAIAGRRLWEKLPEPEIARRVVAGQVRRLGQEVNPELERIVSRAMAYSPDDRYASAEDDAARARGLLEFGVTRHAARSGPAPHARCARRGSISDSARSPTPSAGWSATSPHSRRTREAAESASRTGWTSGVSSGTPASSRTGSDMQSKVRHARTDGALSVSATGATPMRRRRSRGRGAWIALGVAAMVLAGVLVVPGRITAPERPALAAPASTATGATRTITITAKPDGARVFVDDEPVVGNPAIVKVPQGSAHTIRLEHEGHESSERAVVADADISLTIELTPQSSASPASPLASESAPSRSRGTRQRTPAFVAKPSANAPVKSAAAGKAQCDPPYYFSEGIKKYKPECI